MSETKDLPQFSIKGLEKDDQGGLSSQVTVIGRHKEIIALFVSVLITQPQIMEMVMEAVILAMTHDESMHDHIKAVPIKGGKH